MTHWSEKYPHNLYATVILKNNKIKLWKVGDRKLDEDYDVAKMTEANSEYSYQEKSFVTNNDVEHNEVFNKLAPNWFSQWQLHEDYKGLSPFPNEPLNNIVDLPY